MAAGKWKKEIAAQKKIIPGCDKKDLEADSHIVMIVIPYRDFPHAVCPNKASPREAKSRQ